MFLGTAFAAFLLRFPSLRCPAAVTGDPATYFERVLTYPPAILTQTLFTTGHCSSVTNPMFFPSDYQVNIVRTLGKYSVLEIYQAMLRIFQMGKFLWETATH